MRIHDLRRSFGSWQAMTGSSLPIIGKSLGHKQAQTTMIYARLQVDPVRQSVETATTAMLEAGGVKLLSVESPKQGKQDGEEHKTNTESNDVELERPLAGM